MDKSGDPQRQAPNKTPATRGPGYSACSGGGCTCCRNVPHLWGEVRQLRALLLAGAARAEARVRAAAQQAEDRAESEKGRRLEAEEALQALRREHEQLKLQLQATPQLQHVPGPGQLQERVPTHRQHPVHQHGEQQAQRWGKLQLDYGLQQSSSGEPHAGGGGGGDGHISGGNASALNIWQGSTEGVELTGGSAAAPATPTGHRLQPQRHLGPAAMLAGSPAFIPPGGILGGGGRGTTCHGGGGTGNLSGGAVHPQALLHAPAVPVHGGPKASPSAAPVGALAEEAGMVHRAGAAAGPGGGTERPQRQQQLLVGQGEVVLRGYVRQQGVQRIHAGQEREHAPVQVRGWCEE